MRNDKVTVALKWSAAVITLIGALMTSMAFDPYNVWTLNLGSVLFIIWSFRIRDLAMITVNLGLFAIYTGGTVWRLL